MGESGEGLDDETRFCVSWYEQHGFTEGAFGDADTLARARGASLDSLVHVRIIKCPGFFGTFLFVPGVLVAVEELLPMALVLHDLATFETILVPVMILLAIAIPFVRCVDGRHMLPLS